MRLCIKYFLSIQVNHQWLWECFWRKVKPLHSLKQGKVPARTVKIKVSLPRLSITFLHTFLRTSPTRSRKAHLAPRILGYFTPELATSTLGNRIWLEWALYSLPWAVNSLSPAGLFRTSSKKLARLEVLSVIPSIKIQSHFMPFFNTRYSKG